MHNWPYKVAVMSDQNVFCNEDNDGNDENNVSDNHYH